MNSMPFSALLARWVSDASRRWSPEAVAQAESPAQEMPR